MSEPVARTFKVRSDNRMDLESPIGASTTLLQEWSMLSGEGWKTWMMKRGKPGQETEQQLRRGLVKLQVPVIDAKSGA